MDKVLVQTLKNFPSTSETLRQVEFDKTGILINTQSVLLYCSKWNNSLLYRGKINLSVGQLAWTCLKEITSQKIALKQLLEGKILSGSKALEYIQHNTENSKGVQKRNCIVVFTSYILSIVFDQEEICKTWLKSLKELLSQQTQHFFTEFKSEESDSDMDISVNATYGAIFDISEPEQNNEMWKEIKVTFVKEDFSHSEFLNFDLHQKNLFESSQEVLSSVEDYTDTVNKLILESYLVDLITLETTNRIERLETVKKTKELLPNTMKLKRKTNTKIRTAYLELPGNEMGKQVINMMLQYEMSDNGQGVFDCFNLLYMQKVAIELEMHHLACKHQIMSMRKSLIVELPEDQIEPVMRRSESPGAIQRRIESIVQKKIEKPVKGSENRGTCECLIY